MAAIAAANAAAQASSNFQGVSGGEPSLLGLFFILGIVVIVGVLGYFMFKID